MTLSERRCVTCGSGMDPLSYDAEDALLQQVPGWEIDRLFEHKIHKTYILTSFAEAIDFVNKVAVIAQQEDHHPELRINFRKVTVELYTHSISGLSENDFIVAAKIEEIIKEPAMVDATG